MSRATELLAVQSAPPDAARIVPDAARLVAEARAAQRDWRLRPLTERLAVIAAFRRRLAADAAAVAAAVTARPPEETLAAEILPLLECCRFLERRARAVLRPERRSGRAPLWLRGTVVDVIREPFGTVLVVGAGNYGLMLAGVQALHALTAGNAVIVKPAPGSRGVLERFAALLAASGLPQGLLAMADASPHTAHELLASGVDKLVFTGSSGAGRELLRTAAAQLVPATLELSGWDACIVLDGADLERTAAALAFALTLNAGRTCLAPRRVIASAAVCAALERALIAKLAGAAPLPFEAPALPGLVADAVRQGARVLAGAASEPQATGPIALGGVTPRMKIFDVEVFGPVVLLCATAPESVVAWANAAPFALGASVFGPERHARALARELDAGVVTINDVVVPAAHGEVPIAARGASGFGATRGAEGLLEMTRPKAVTATRARRPLHLAARDTAANGAPLLAAYAQAAYGGGVAARWRALQAAFKHIRSEGSRGSV